MTRFLIPGGLAAALCTMIPNAPADEGMWLFNNPPRKLLKEKYGFDATDRVARARAESRPSASTAAAPARSSRPTGW